MSVKKALSHTTLVLILFFVLFFGSANYTRHKLIDKYNQGVQYYENGCYKESMDVFYSLFGWGTCVDISPEEYYDMALTMLYEQNSNIKICPHCGLLIE